MLPQIAKSNTLVDSSASEMAGTSWSYGWYLFEDGKVVGPLQADDAFSRAEKTPSGQMRMVSRKGFTQWYPLGDFAELHAMAGKYADQLAQAKRTIAPDRHTYADHQPIAKVLGPTPRPQVATATPDSFARIKLASQGIQENRNAPAQNPLTRKEKKRLRQQERRAQKVDATHAAKARESESQPQPRILTFDDQYLLVASRLRLGQQRSPFLAGFIFFPITIGGYWGAWLSRVSEELTWHLTGSSRVNFVLPIWMALIPGVHLVFAWMLARLMAEVEMQNGYRTVSPVLATLLAIFPPFYMQLLQGAMNRHWRLHVYHSMDRRLMDRS